MKKIVVVAGYAPSLINFRGPLLRAMITAGHRVTAIAPDIPADVATELARRDVDSVAVPLARAGLNPIRDWAYYRALVEHFRRDPPDIVLAYTHKPVVYSALAARTVPAARVYALITGLGYAFANGTAASLKQTLTRSALCWLYRRTRSRRDGVIFQNEDDRILFQKLRLVDPATPLKVVRGSGIDLADYPRQPAPAGPCRFLLVARLLADKGIREYVAAARALRSVHPAAEFHLVGPLDPNPAAIAAAEVEGWHRDQVVIYHGAVKDVRPHLAQCNVFVLPSYREGTPRTVLEAMATGRPVITTDTAGCRDTVFSAGKPDRNGIAAGVNGLLVPVKDAAALQTAMLRFLSSPGLALAMGREARRLAEEYYAVEKINTEMLSFMGLYHESPAPSPAPL